MKQLERTLDLGSVVAISMGAMLGSGIFVLPGMAAAIAGPSVWLAYVAAGLCVLPAALSTAELATAMPTSGGKYFFIDRTFGPLAGTISGLGLWLSMLLKSAFALVGFGTYLAAIVDLPLKPTALTLLGGILALNLLGARRVAKALKWVVVICAGGLVLLVAVGLGEVELERLGNPFPNGASGFVTAIAFVFVSFAGVTKVAAIAEEVKDPDRNLPAGILISLIITTLLYGGVILVLVGTVPGGELAGDLHPIYVMADRVAGPTVGIAVAILAVVTMTSMANAGLLAASRFPFAMSRDDLVPRFLSVVHPTLHTPARAILLSGVVVGAAVLLVDVEKIAKLASAFLIIMFVAVNAAVLVLRESDSQWYRPGFKSPGYPLFQGFGILAGLGLLYVIGGLALAAAAAIAVPGALVFVAYGRQRTSRRSVAKRIRESHRPQEPTLGAVGEAEAAKAQPAVIVALLGFERSPETVVEIGAGISRLQPLGVVHLTEVPEQIFLSSELSDDLRIDSLRRRLRVMAERIEVEIGFDTVVTHDLVDSIRQVSERSSCAWILKAWRRGGEESGSLLRSPLAWSLYGLTCNLATFKDAGVRYVRRILVLAEPGPNDALVVNTCDHLARLWGADLTFVRFVPDDASEATVQSQLDYIDEIRHLCRAETHHALLRGHDEIEALVMMTAGFDLLVMGEAERGFFRSHFLKTRRERLTERAACSVLRLKTPRAEVHRGFKGERAPTDAVAVRLTEFISKRSVAVQLREDRKATLFERIGELLARSLPNVSARTITDALWERERMQNTAVGDGLAMPHGTLDGLERPLVGLFVTTKPIDYEAPDDEPVQVCFVTLCSPGQRLIHLKLMASLARLVAATDFVARQRGARNAGEALAALQDCLAELDRED